MAITALLFDKDGTFVDFDATWGCAAYRVMSAVCHGNQATFDRLAEAMRFVARDLKFLPTSPMIAGATTDYAPTWAAILGLESTEDFVRDIDRRFAVETLDCLTAIGEPVAVLDTLRALGLRLGVATNDSEASARLQCGKLGLLPSLDFIAGYDSGHGAKPDPGMVTAFVRRVDAEVTEVALVGDSLHDLAAARAAGVMAIAVLSGPASRAEIEPYADHVIATIGDLPGLVQSLNRGMTAA